MTEEDFEIISKETAWRGFFRVDRYRLRHRLHEGGWSEPLTREVFERGHAAALLPYDPERDEIVLVEQFRIGAMTAGLNPWVAELVAGMMDAGENPEEVARRETVEETGCEPRQLIRICEYLSTPGGSSEVVSLYCGRIDSQAATGVHGKKEEAEDILVVALPFASAVERLDRGEFNNAVTIIGLQWLARHRDKVRRLWLP